MASFSASLEVTSRQSIFFCKEAFLLKGSGDTVGEYANDHARAGTGSMVVMIFLAHERRRYGIKL